MENHFTLIKNFSKKIEKRIFPHFPFDFLTFKGEQIFVVRDINNKGMRLFLKDGEPRGQVGDTLRGRLRWKKACLDLAVEIKWIKENYLGVVFVKEDHFDHKIGHFLSVENIILAMRSIKQGEFGLELPCHLRYWLQSDGPVEIFIWSHKDGEVASFQILMMSAYLEYEDGKGLRSGQVVGRKDLETPLIQEDEFAFQLDDEVDQEKLNFAQKIVCALPQEFLSSEVRDFVKLKLSLPCSP